MPLENSSRWKSYNIIQNNTSHTIIPQLGHWVFNFGWAHSFPASGTVISTLAMSTCLEGRRTRSDKKNCISFEVSIIQNNRLFNHSPYIDGWTCRAARRPYWIISRMHQIRIECTIERYTKNRSVLETEAVARCSRTIVLSFYVQGAYSVKLTSDVQACAAV